ncbi:S8 family serine peptidase [Streptomyces sp. P9-A2]|uniref:S8 family serine peptidase n=1 Tax=Streptomyces sp. P9-A2 TaxID=3072284 RepID=UPI002FC6C8B7
MFLAVAAGNDGEVACDTSPAGASGVTTVAASDKNDNAASFPNHGSCVEPYASGVGIASAWVLGDTNAVSGTSMASPHGRGCRRAPQGCERRRLLHRQQMDHQRRDQRCDQEQPRRPPDLLLFENTL